MDETSCIGASFLLCELFWAALHPGGFGYTKLAWERGSGLGNEESEFLCNLGGICKSETILKEGIRLHVAGIYCDVKYLVKTLKRHWSKDNNSKDV